MPRAAHISSNTVVLIKRTRIKVFTNICCLYRVHDTRFFNKHDFFTFSVNRKKVLIFLLYLKKNYLMHLLPVDTVCDFLFYKFVHSILCVLDDHILLVPEIFNSLCKH